MAAFPRCERVPSLDLTGKGADITAGKHITGTTVIIDGGTTVSVGGI
jgi:hypothetical protein